MNAANPAEMVLRAFGLTDVAAGRNLPMPDSASWGVDWIPGDATARAALDAVLIYEGQIRHGQISEEDRRPWDAYPDRIRRLVIRIMVGAADASPWIRKAYADPVFLGDESGAVGAGSGTAAIMSRCRFATAPWVDARIDSPPRCPARLSRLSPVSSGTTWPLGR